MTPDIVLGPPGTGKTTDLLGQVEDSLARGVQPEEIGFVTFTKRGAQEAIDRAVKRFNLGRNRFRWFRTLHSLCFQSAGLSSTDVFEGTKVVEFGDWLGVKLSESVSFDEGSTFGYEPGDRAMFMENLARIRCIPLRQLYDENDDHIPWSLVERVQRGLVEYKRSRGLVDYTDMLAMFVDGTWQPRLRELYVDESQDLSQLQWRVVQRLTVGCERVVIAGDDDQAIYRWAGADLPYFVALEGRVRVLHQSWRVPRASQEISQRIINNVHLRRPKEWSPRPEDGTVRRVKNMFDLDLRGKEMLILGRNAHILRPVMKYLQREGVIYEWRGHGSVSKTALESVVLWEQLRKGEAIVADDAKRVYTLLSSGKGVRRGYKTLPGFSPNDKVTMNDLVERGGLLTGAIWHEALDRIPQDEKMYMLNALRKGESLRRKPRVRISTIHGSKGGESDHVVLFRDMASRTFAEYRKSPEDEARVWYVGVTRAKQSLDIVEPNTRNAYDV